MLRHIFSKVWYFLVYDLGGSACVHERESERLNISNVFVQVLFNHFIKCWWHPMAFIYHTTLNSLHNYMWIVDAYSNEHVVNRIQECFNVLVFLHGDVNVGHIWWEAILIDQGLRYQDCLIKMGLKWRDTNFCYSTCCHSHKFMILC